MLSSFGAKASENDNLVLQVVVLSTESGSSTKVDVLSHWTDPLVTLVVFSYISPRPTQLSFLCSFRTSRIMKFSQKLHEWKFAMPGYKYDMKRNRNMLSLLSCNKCGTKTYIYIYNQKRHLPKRWGLHMGCQKETKVSCHCHMQRSVKLRAHKKNTVTGSTGDI